MKRLNITKERFEKFNESVDDAVEELCYDEGEKVIDACHTIEDFNDKIKELTGNYIFDPDEFFTTVHAELGLFLDDH